MSIRNFDALFDPAAIALVGASNAPRSVGRMLAENLLKGGFAGPIMPVSATDKAIHSTLTYPSVEDLPVVPALAILAARPDTVPELIARLGARGCRAAVVVNSGLGSAHIPAELRQRMLDAAKPHLMRLVGPDSLGLISTTRAINASFAPMAARPGNIAFVSQSGTIVTAMLDWADRRGIGFSHVVSLGDMSDVDFGDMLDFLSADRATRSILLYVENVTHARKFMSAARAAARVKPVLVVKAGRSRAGARATLSHTGALAGTDIVYDAAFRRAGLLRVGDLDELFSAAAILATGTRATGNRLSVLTNSGGAGILAVDEIAARGARVAKPSDAILERLDAVLPEGWSRGNPVDIVGDAGAERYAAALEILLSERDSDAVLVIHCPNAVTDAQEVAAAVAKTAAARRAVPVLTSWLGGTTAQRPRALLMEAKVPTFSSPEGAVRAFTHLADFRRNQELLLETPSAGVAIAPERIAQARHLVESVLATDRSVLTEPEAKQLLGFFGIPSVETLVAADPAEAGAHFARLGVPVALKILSPDLMHKSDVGGVALNLASREEVERVAAAMLARVRQAAPDARQVGFTVQPMVLRPNGHELIVGITQDATFGPVLLFGRGGKATEVIGDRTVGLPPLNSVLARDMIGRTRISRLLAGYRDVPAAPLDIVADVLVRLSELVVHLPEILEFDINPLLADASGVIALDARVVIGRASARAVHPAISPYPHELEQDGALQDGTAFTLRPIRPEDEVPLVELTAACTPEDLRLRFLGPIKTFPHEMAARLSQIDYDREMAFVAVARGSAYGRGPILGVVRLMGDPEHETAEFAILVRSDMKGRGLGYRLMSEILAFAARSGFREVYSDVLRGNRAMLHMARDLGFSSTIGLDGEDTTRISIILSPTVTAAGPTG